jgi:hypothetical protein
LRDNTISIKGRIFWADKSGPGEGEGIEGREGKEEARQGRVEENAFAEDGT